ncbi:MAG: hypothetical protein ACPLRY_07920 [Candidatus Bathyarchaeales archaeon]
MAWSKTYGGVYDDQAYSLVVTSDEGFALAGYTNSFGAGQCDFWLVKTEPIVTPTATPTTEPFPTTAFTAATAITTLTAATATAILLHHKKHPTDKLQLNQIKNKKQIPRPKILNFKNKTSPPVKLHH